MTKDIIHSIFSNLAELLDFQRRFLFSLEANLALPQDEQRIGAVFIQYVQLINFRKTALLYMMQCVPVTRMRSKLPWKIRIV